MSNWIRFVEDPPDPAKVTKSWEVRALGGNDLLGVVKWYAPWRKYCFWSYASIFEQDCLRDIASFIESETTKHRLARKGGLSVRRSQGC